MIEQTITSRHGPADNQLPQRVRSWINERIIERIPASTLILRELRIGLPLVLGFFGPALIFIIVVKVATVSVSLVTGQTQIDANETVFGAVSVVYYILTGLLVTIPGTMTGAEEMDSAPGNFSHYLPIGRSQRIREKMVGSCLAFAGWNVFGVILFTLLLLLFPQNPMNVARNLFMARFHVDGVIPAIGFALFGCLLFTIPSIKENPDRELHFVTVELLRLLILGVCMTRRFFVSFDCRLAELPENRE